MTDFPDSGQLDLFEHSRAVTLANDVIDALLARDAAFSTERFNGLCVEEPGHRACEALQTLCRALGDKAADFMRPFWRELACVAAGGGRAGLEKLLASAAQIAHGAGMELTLPKPFDELAADLQAVEALAAK